MNFYQIGIAQPIRESKARPMPETAESNEARRPAQPMCRATPLSIITALHRATQVRVCPADTFAGLIQKSTIIRHVGE